MSRLEKSLLNQIARASKDFELIAPGDRIMACISGGKDSFAMLHLLRKVQERVSFDFSIVAVHLDQKQPGFPSHLIREYLEREGVEHRIVERDTYKIVREKIPEGKTYCPLCSRLRRGILYDVAVELGATKIALGHHRDDVIETLLLNVLYSGQLKAMPPRLRSDDGRNTVIRPLVYCAEEDIIEFAKELQFPVIPCNLCSSQENHHRKKVKALIAALHAENPNVKGNLLAAIGNVRPTHLLDPKLRELYGLDRMTGTDDFFGEGESDGEGEAADGEPALRALRVLSGE